MVVQYDRLFSELNPNCGEFEFDEKVANVFDDMISRSVPLYTDVQRSVPVLLDLLDHEHLKVIDLGCSTGTSLIHVANILPHRTLDLIGVDNSEAMLKKCREKISSVAQGRLDANSRKLIESIELHQAHVQDFQFSDASAVLMNYTLQFVSLNDRPEVLSRIRSSIRPGGFLLVSEKVVHDRPDVDDALVELYFEFKRRQGYSELEISRKRDALENVLVPLTIEKNFQLFRNAGFERIEILLKWFNFATFVCYPS